jgi:hypothetical protein
MDMRDYSEAFQPGLHMTDFSKEALVRLWEVAGKMYTSLAGTYQRVLRERLGEQLALELDAEVWRRQTPVEVRLCRRAMGITGDDVASLFKHLQVDPGAGGIWPEFDLELKDSNHGILTVKRCLALEHFERGGEAELARLKHTCEVLDGEGFQDTAALFHRRMKAMPLKLPPRNNKDEIACQWEFKVEQEAPSK